MLRMALLAADGWQALFEGKDEATGEKRTFTEDLIGWLEDEGEVVGICLNASGHVVRATSMINFRSYEQGDSTTIVPAAPGWWVVQRVTGGEADEAWWSPVITWIVGKNGYPLEAVGLPDSEGFTILNESRDGRVFVYEPDRKKTGTGPIPPELEDAPSPPATPDA